jgi:transcription elongation factor Elf1
MAATPDELITDARNYATTVTAAGSAALANAIAVLDQIGQGYLAEEGPKVTIATPAPGDPGEVPEWDGKRIDFKEFVGIEPVLSPEGTLSLPSEPGNAPDVADYIEPPKPTGQADTSLLLGVPTLTGFTPPVAPNIDVDGIPKPVLIDLVIPPMPTYREPEFQGVRPDVDIVPPTDLDVLMRTQYATISPVMQDAVSAQLDAYLDREFPQFRSAMATLEARLATYMAGGTALTPAVENAIYNRTLDKTNIDARRASEESWGKAARAGFSMPSITLLAQQQDIDQARRDNNARAATDIAVKQAELEQSNLQFAVTQSSMLRKLAMDSALTYYSGLVQINGQALQYAREVVDAVVKTYDITAKIAELQSRIYEADARVYEARLRGAMATIEAWESQIKGIEAQSNVDMAKVNLYRALLDAAKTEAEVFQAQIDAFNGQINGERSKVELYKARVDSYVAQVNGFTAQWQGYNAAVSGESSKVQASAEQIRAFSARVQAYEATVRARGLELDIRSRVNTQKIDVYKGRVDAYAALNNARAIASRADIDSYLATIKAFDSKANAIAEKSKAEVAIYQVGLQGLIEAAKLQFEYMQERNKIDVQKAVGTAQVASSIGNMYAAVAEASLAGMNSLASSSTTTSS